MADVIANHALAEFHVAGNHGKSAAFDDVHHEGLAGLGGKLAQGGLYLLPLLAGPQVLLG